MAERCIICKHISAVPLTMAVPFSLSAMFKKKIKNAMVKNRLKI